MVVWMQGGRRVRGKNGDEEVAIGDVTPPQIDRCLKIFRSDIANRPR